MLPVALPASYHPVIPAQAGIHDNPEDMHRWPEFQKKFNPLRSAEKFNLSPGLKLQW
jgi:hypothetical protein